MLKKKNHNVLILSNDKFKWYSNVINLNNFKFLYDFDNFEKKIIIEKAYTPDVYKINEKFYIFPLVNFPIIQDDFFTLNKNIIKNINNDDFIYEEINFNNGSFSDLSKIEYQYIKFYNILIKLSILTSLDIKKFQSNTMCNFLYNYIIKIKNQLYKIFNFLSSNTKKEIFKLSIDNGQKIFSKLEIDNYIYIISKYKSLVELFQIIKVVGIKFYSNDKNFILFNTLFFSNLIEIYDEIEDNLYKIRKLSNAKSNIAGIFSNLNITYIYLRKYGFFKKNIYW